MSPDPSHNGDPAAPDSFEMHLEPVDPGELHLESVPTVEAVTTLPKRGFGFWKALLWCFLFLLLTQIVPAVFLFGGLLITDSAELAKHADSPKELLNQPQVQQVLRAAVLAGPVCGVIFSLFF